MIPPVFVVARIGVIPLILPVVLLWPLLALVWMGSEITGAVRKAQGPDPLPSSRLLPTVFGVLGSLRGLRVDLQPRRGPSIAVRLY